MTKLNGQGFKGLLSAINKKLHIVMDTFLLKEKEVKDDVCKAEYFTLDTETDDGYLITITRLKGYNTKTLEEWAELLKARNEKGEHNGKAN